MLLIIIAVIAIAIVIGVIIAFMPGKHETPGVQLNTGLATGPRPVSEIKNSFIKAGPNKRVCAYLLIVCVSRYTNQFSGE